MPESRQIGWLVSTPDGKFGVIGRCCEAMSPRGIDANKPSPPIFAVNIFPYGQRCLVCGSTIHTAASKRWPELFDGKLKGDIPHVD